MRVNDYELVFFSLFAPYDQNTAFECKDVTHTQSSGTIPTISRDDNLFFSFYVTPYQRVVPF